MDLPAHVQHRHNDKRPTILPRQKSTGPLAISPSTASPRSYKVERGRKNVSRACQVCRQRRIRCNTDRPCRPCQSNGVECIDDGGAEGVDLRTIRLGPQNQRIFIQHKTLLDHLLQSIRSGTADTVLECIKDGGSLSQIAQVLQSVEEMPSPELGSIWQEGQYEIADEIDGGDQGRLRDVTIKQLDTSAKSLKNFGNLPMSSAFKANGFSPHIQEQQISHLGKPTWECCPVISDDASLHDVFSRSCFSFRNLARQQLADGALAEVILSEKGIEMNLLFRDRTTADPYTVSTWACELLKTFHFVHPVVQLAAAEAVACLMRWLIAPTKENYLALPPMSIPTDRQLFVPHSIGIDVMMLPEIRNALLVRGSAAAWTDIVTPSTMELNWPYSTDACIEAVLPSQHEQGSCMRLSRAFLEHIRNTTNLSLDREVLKTFPEFAGKFRWHGSASDQSSEARDAISLSAYSGSTGSSIATQT